MLQPTGGGDVMDTQKHSLHPLWGGGRCIGIDASLTSTGIALLEGDLLHTWLLKTKLRGSERLAYYDEEFVRLLSEYRPDAVCLEGYAYGRHNKAHDIGELGGIIRLNLWRAGVPHYVVAPPTLKKFVTGSGAGGKQGISLHLFKRWGISVEQEDEADATGLALMGAYRHFDLQGTKAQEEAVAKMEVRQGPRPVRVRTRMV